MKEDKSNLITAMDSRLRGNVVLIVGLGNPGAEYAKTRHNAGFMAVDALASKAAPEHSAGGHGRAGATGVGGGKKEKNALVLKRLTTHDSRLTIFAKPQTFMNRSGESVRALMTFYKIPLENLIVIHDDIDLPLGTVRQKTGGGSAGHNGIKSIDAAVGNDYRRIRIGIGRPGKSPDSEAPMMAVDDWVLGNFTAEELKIIKKVIEELTA